MTIYIVLWISIIICCFIEVNFSVVKIDRLKIRTRKLSFVFLYLFILLLGILREEFLGVDVYNYRSHYFEYGNIGFMELLKGAYFEKGYIILNKVIYIFTKDFWTFKAILYFITFTLFSFVIYKNSKYISVSYLFYIGFGFLGFNFCILRQALSVSICFCAFQFIKEKKAVPFILSIILAATIHQTAICYLLLYPIVNGFYKDRFGLKKIFLVILAITIGNNFLPYLFRFGINDYSTEAVSGTGYNMLVLYIFLMIVIRILYKNHCEDSLKSEYNSLYAIIYFQIDAIFFSLISRMVNYFSVMLSVFVPNLIFYYKKKNLLLIFFVLLCTLMFYISFVINDPTQIVPYSSIFKK